MKITRLRKSVQLCASAIAAAFGFDQRAFAATVFSDGNFNSPNWTSIVLPDPNGNGGSYNAAQNTIGGNPGSYMNISISNAGSGGLAAFVTNNAFVYSPSAQGVITSIDYSFDLKAISSSNVGLLAFANLALMQNGNVYVYTEQDNSAISWASFGQTGLRATDFAEIFPTVNGEFSTNSSINPNFTNNGSALEIGFLNNLNTPGGGQPNNESMGLDNFAATINTVPEPGSATLVLLGSLGLFLARRKRATAV